MISPRPITSMDEARLTRLPVEREIRYVANKHCPEASFKCQVDTALVARVLKARRFLCIGEDVRRGASLELVRVVKLALLVERRHGEEG